MTAFAAQPPAGPGWNVGVVALDGSPLTDLPGGVIAVATDGDAPSTAVERVRHALAEFRPAVVVAGPIQSAALPAVRAGALPVVALSWAFDLLADAREGSGRDAAREALAGASALLCDARAVAVAAKELGMPASRITIAPWGVDLDHFRPNAVSGVREALGWNEAHVVLSTRSHEPLYRLDTVVEGFAEAASRLPRLRLAMLGNGSLRATLENRARTTGAARSIQFTGPIGQAELPGWYAAADVYVSASPIDGTSVSLMEALACGVPAIVADIPSNREWIEPGTNGFLFPVGDSRALAAALVHTAEMPGQQRNAISRAARATAEERADWAVNARRIRQVISASAGRGH